MFDLGTYLADLDPRLLANPEGRRVLTRLDPLLFSLVYLGHHLRGKETGDQISFNQFHLDLFEMAQKWVKQNIEPMSSRHAFIAPRGAGKSTMVYLLLPLWAAAHGHRSFVAAFADSASMAERHLGSLKAELENNALLRQDFPDLCTPRRRPSGTVASDNRAMYLAQNGFTFVAKGIDSNALGLKVGNQRPDLIITDDIEPDAANYSAYQKEQRLSTLLEAVFPMAIHARVMMVGTTSMIGSITHDLVKQARGEETEAWVADERIQCHWYPALVTDEETGEESSLWPEKWSLQTLNSIRHTRQFRSQYQNDPMAMDGEFWVDTDFRYEPAEAVTRTVISIDPAVTTNQKSDFTGIAVVALDALHKRAVVREAMQLRIQPGKPLRDRVLALLDIYPETNLVLVESNQGGNIWQSVLHDLPVRVVLIHQSQPKEVRAARLLQRYQRGLVVHEKRLPAAEQQMVAFPKAPFDDVIDAIGAGVEALFGSNKSKRPTVATVAVV